MGKQINFYMDEDRESAFFEHILNDGGTFLDDRDTDPVTITRLQDLLQNDWFQRYLYKPEFGPLTLTPLPNGRRFIDTSRSPVIEFTRTVVRHDEKELQKGRLWLEMRYWDSDQNLVVKPEALDRWYASLSRWIRKNLPRVEFKLGFHTYKEYMSPPLKELMDIGYELM